MIKFRELDKNDSHILHSWLQEPHVREFWDNGLRTLDQTVSYYYRNEGVKKYIFWIDNQPVGYIQFYDINLNKHYKKFSKNNQKTVGVDFFIGNKDFLGKGYAKEVMKKFIETYCHDARRIIVDPDPMNHKAIHAYQTCGFVKLSSCIVDNEKHEIMVYDAPVS